MQAFTVVVGLIELDVFRSWRSFEIVHVDMLQPAELCLRFPKHRLVGVARIASLFGRNAVILEMRCGQMPRIVEKQALPVGFHDVAGQAEFRALGTFQFGREARSQAQDGQDEKEARTRGVPSMSPFDLEGDCNMNRSPHHLARVLM
jgi:hypothetical protein